MYILQGFPSTVLRPAPFLPKSAELLQNTLACVRRMFIQTLDAVGRWTKWAEEAPQTDNVGDYMQARGIILYRPCHEVFYMSRTKLSAHSLRKDRQLKIAIEMPQFRAGKFNSYILDHLTSTPLKECAYNGVVKGRASSHEYSWAPTAVKS